MRVARAYRDNGAHSYYLVPTAEHPAAEVNHIVRGIVRRGLRPVPPKALISLRVDADVLEWCKAQGAGYQTRMNAVLRAFKDASSERQ